MAGTRTSTGAADLVTRPGGVQYWDQARTCGLCGGQDIPRGVSWTWWVDGKPAHFLCASLYELTRRTKQRAAQDETLYRLCVFSERMTVIRGPHCD